MSGREDTITIPGSKSHTIRAILIAMFAYGVSHIRNPLFSEDTKAAFDASEKLGAKVIVDENENTVTIDSRMLGKGIETVELDMLNSGTTTYLLTGLAASLGIPVTIKGDESLSSRPVKPLLDAYEKLGAEVVSNNGMMPFTIKGPVSGGEVSIEARTSQYLSSLLLGLVLAKGSSRVHVPLLYEKPYVTMTLSWLEKQRADCEISEDYSEASIKGNGRYTPFDASIPGDYSSATFFFILAAAGKRRIRVKGLWKDDSQGDKRVLEVLGKMGALVTWDEDDVIVEGRKIRGGYYDINDIPDALPALSVLSLFASSPVTLGNVPQARIKETDRIKVMHDELEKAGARIEELDDGLVIYPSNVHDAYLQGHDDHRVIMALSILGKISGRKIVIDDTSKAGVTFPTFFNLLDSLS